MLTWSCLSVFVESWVTQKQNSISFGLPLLRPSLMMKAMRSVHLTLVEECVML